MKYKVCEVEINPDDDVTIMRIIREVAYFENRPEALDYLDYLATITICEDGYYESHFAVLERVTDTISDYF